MRRHKAPRRPILSVRDCEILEQCVQLVRKTNVRFFASVEINALLFRLQVTREEAQEAANFAAAEEEAAEKRAKAGKSSEAMLIPPGRG
jgi:hypothetical protein